MSIEQTPADSTESILHDLINELREPPRIFRRDGQRFVHYTYVQACADRADSRMQEVTDDS